MSTIFTSLPSISRLRDGRNSDTFTLAKPFQRVAQPLQRRGAWLPAQFRPRPVDTISGRPRHQVGPVARDIGARSQRMTRA